MGFPLPELKNINLTDPTIHFNDVSSILVSITNTMKTFEVHIYRNHYNEDNVESTSHYSISRAKLYHIILQNITDHTLRSIENHHR